MLSDGTAGALLPPTHRSKARHAGRYAVHLAHYENAPILEQSSGRAALHELYYREALDAT